MGWLINAVYPTKACPRFAYGRPTGELPRSLLPPLSYEIEGNRNGAKLGSGSGHFSFDRQPNAHDRNRASRLLNVLEQLSQLLPRVKHAGLYGGGRDAENFHAFDDRLLMIVDEVDDLPMLRRQSV
jgi:hypothetical protein